MSRTSAAGIPSASLERLSLITRIARMYHEEGVRQPEIASRLHLSQSRVSRLLKDAVDFGIVRTVVVPPVGVHTDLERLVRDKYGLSDVVIADTASDDDYSILSALSGAGASYFETTLSESDRVGISSWSSTLYAMVDKMVPTRGRNASAIVQVLGGLGAATVQMKATHLVERLATVTGASPVFFSAPGVVETAKARDTLLADEFAREVIHEWSKLTVLIAGIGSVTPSPMLKDSGNAISTQETAQLTRDGAVGDICLHFFDRDGAPIETDFSTRTVGIDAQLLRRIPRRVGIAGGERKYEAIRAALQGRWVDVIITDSRTATRLASEPAPNRQN